MRLGSSQLLNRLLEPVGLLLTETDASPGVDAGLAHQVLHLRGQWVWLCDHTILIGLTLGEVWSDLLDVLFTVLSNLFVVTVVVAAEEFAWVHSLLDHVGDLFETLERSVWVVQDHMLEDLLEVAV